MLRRPTVRRARLAAAALACPLAAACSATTAAHETPARVVRLDQPFSLAVGQTAALDDAVEGAPFAVTFLGVADDSRCAADVQCVWEGNARVRLRLRAGAASADTAAHTSGRFTPDPALGGLVVSVVALAPLARAGQPISAGAYVATLRVARR